MSGLLHKVKDAMSGEKNTNEAVAANTGKNEYGSGTSGSTGYDSKSGYDTQSTGSTTTGPHSSKLGNQVDPRVDSDMSGSRGTTGGMMGSTGQGYDSSTTGQGYGSSTTGQGYGSSTTGPHDSSLANKADPRVDSDLSDTRGTTGGMTGSSTTSSGLTGHHEHHRPGEDIVHGGGHYTETAKRLDPQIGGGSTSSSGLETTTGSTGYGSNTGTGGDYTGSTGSTGYGSNTGTTGGYSGSTSNESTTGPHSSSMMNKMDPRIDSDRDGSGTTGGYSRTARGDRLDAATALPSQFAQRHGDPEIMHDDHTHNRAGRHGSKVNEDLLKYGGGHQ